MRRVLAFSLLGAAASCAAPEESPAVRTVVERYYERLSARDWAALPASFWPEATLSTVWQPPGESGPRVVVTAIESFTAMAPEGPGSRSIFEERPLEVRLRVGDGIATAWVRYAARFGDPGNVTCWTGIDAITLLRHDGEWRIASIGYSNDGEGAATGEGRCT